MRCYFILAACLASLATAENLKIRRIAHAIEQDVDLNEIEDHQFYRRGDLEDEALERRQFGRQTSPSTTTTRATTTTSRGTTTTTTTAATTTTTRAPTTTTKQLVSCGRAPIVPNANLTNPGKSDIYAGDVLVYRCSPAFMRLVDGSLSVTCQDDGTFSKLPVCQSYTFSCRRNKAAREYSGRLNQTRCGQPCQAWSVETPVRPASEVKAGLNNPLLFPEYRNTFDAQNYCRNPDPNENHGPWCYIGNYAGSGARWGFCDVQNCDASDTFDEYDRKPGACGCTGESLFDRFSFGNIRTMESTTLQSCKRECDNNAECQGLVWDETQEKCWLKKCSCTDQQIQCSADKMETYYRKKSPSCPGIDFWDRFGQRHCFFSLFNYNITSIVFDFETSRKLCSNLFPTPSDVASLENDAEWDFLARNIASLRIPLTYSRIWIGLYRNENESDSWRWVNAQQTLLNYTRWAPGEPTNGYEEQCSQVVLNAGPSEAQASVGRWADETCRVRAPVICEAKMPNWRPPTKREDMKRSDIAERGDDDGYRPLCKTASCEEDDN